MSEYIQAYYYTTTSLQHSLGLYTYAWHNLQKRSLASFADCFCDLKFQTMNNNYPFTCAFALQSLVSHIWLQTRTGNKID